MGSFTIVGAIIIRFPPIIAAMLAIGVTVASYPGGLNLILLVLKAVAAKNMRKHNMICKNLSITEELGSITCLCTDKTGTITENKMKVASILLHDEVLDFSGGTIPKKTAYSSLESYQYLRKAAVLPNTAFFDDSPPADAIGLIYNRDDLSF